MSATASNTLIPPAEALVGVELPNGWTVREKRVRPPGSSGGNFSVGYFVERPGGERAFLKAIDIADQFESGDPDAIIRQVEVFTYERDLLAACGDCDRVVTAIETGSIAAGKIPGTIHVPVFYLIFELAKGDAREQFDTRKKLSLTQSFKVLHNCAVGIQQMHQRLVAHQDLKPSNVLYFNDHRETIQSQLSAKLADLGRGAQHNKPLPREHQNLPVAGALHYAPPELLYGQLPENWHQRRLGCDVYCLGGLIAVFFAGSSVTSMLSARLTGGQHWNDWTGTYENVLPFVRKEFAEVMRFVDACIASELTKGAKPSTVQLKAQQEISNVIRELCDPDPTLRGNPRTRALNQFDLQKYISILNRLQMSASFDQL